VRSNFTDGSPATTGAVSHVMRCGEFASLTRWT
jgi:hypothetical protein